MRNTEAFRNALPMICKLPENLQWVFSNFDDEIQIHTGSMEDLKEKRQLFPGVIWEREYSEYVNTWYYRGTYRGVKVMLSCTEAPITCKPIMKTRKIKKEVPTQTVTIEVEEEYIAGYDCGNGDDDKEEE